MEILDKKLKQVSRVNVDVSEANLLASLSNLQRNVNFLSLRNLAINELFLFNYEEVKENSRRSN